MAKTKQLIYAKDYRTIKVNQDGVYRIHFRGAKDKVNIVVAKGVNAYISHRFCPKTPFADINYTLEENAKVVLSAFSDCKTLKAEHNVTLAQDSSFEAYYGFIGKDITDRWNIDLYKGAFARLTEVSFALDSDKHEHNIATRQLEGNSQVKFRGRGVAVMDAMCKFTTKGIIEKGSSGADCSHKSKILTLSDIAKAQVDPSLIIDEYDVQASHSGSVGRIGKDEMFYMMSRGLSEREVINLIAYGFLVSRIEGFLVRPDRNRFYKAINKQVIL
ncbi:MAG TPA: SufD family Fe-S cluster assembly protein [Clostridia bacterium]